jgi:hypothetical protein
MVSAFNALHGTEGCQKGTAAAMAGSRRGTAVEGQAGMQPCYISLRKARGLILLDSQWK